jgi:hypothetical protein
VIIPTNAQTLTTSVPTVAESVTVMDGNPAFIKDTPAD